MPNKFDCMPTPPCTNVSWLPMESKTMHYPVNSFSSGQKPDGTVDARSFHYVIVNVNAVQRILLIQRPLE